jgi:hypothetical protein
MACNLTLAQTEACCFPTEVILFLRASTRPITWQGTTNNIIITRQVQWEVLNYIQFTKVLFQSSL